MSAAQNVSGAVRSRAVEFGISAALVLLLLLVYAQVRNHEFVDLDDFVLVLNNPHVMAGLSVESLGAAFSIPHREQWTPLVWVSLQIDQELHGLDPGWVLLHNVALHAAATLLLFAFLVGRTGATWLCAFVAAVFAVHPLHVESVAWASERKDALSGLFWMLVLILHGRYADRPSWGRYALLLLAMAGGLLAKPMLVTLPFVLLLLDFWPLGRFGWPPGAAGRRAVVEKLPLFAMVAGVSVVTWLVQQASGTMSYGAELSFSARLANAVDATLFYLQKSLWPSGLAAFYPLRLEGLPSLRVAAEALLLALLSLLALLRARRTPAVFVGWFWFLGVLVPVIGLIQVGEQAYADRYSYLPMVGLSIALAWGASSLARGRAQRRALALAGAVAVAALAVAARAQVEVWRNSERLFEHAARVAPENGFVQLRLATLRLRAGELEAAERHYRRFYELRPEEGRDRLVRFHLGMADRQSRAGNPDAALSRYRQVLEVAPDHARANARLGLALLAAGEPARARPYLERAVHASPGSWELHEGLAQTAAAAARFDAAARHYREALRLEPAQASLRNNLAWLLATCPDASVRDPAAALRLAEALVAEQPGAQELDTLAAAYAAAGRFDQARQAQRRAIAAAEMQGATAAARLFRQRAEAYARGDAWIEPAPEPAAP